MAGSAQPARPPKPAYSPFSGLPDMPAIRELQGASCWVSWDYVWKEERAKWDKPPVNARTGKLGSSTDPKTWAAYDQAADHTSRNGLPGVGFVLSKDGKRSGIDLDGCRDPETGQFQHWAQVAINFGETYAEISPSGRGLRFFVRGIVDGRKIDAAQVEIYTSDRYLTVTGQHVPGTPTEIREAPRLIAYLHERADQFRAAQRAAADLAREQERRQNEKRAQNGATGAGTTSDRARQATGGGRIHDTFANSGDRDPFWRNVNDRAFANPSAWVLTLFPRASQSANGAWRVSSRDLGRDYEEDLSITTSGAKDWGVWDQGDERDGRRTAIALVLEHGGAASAADAALWLCSQLGISPESLGWRGRKADDKGGAQQGSSGATDEDPAAEFAEPPGQQKAQSRADRPERTTIAHQGVLVPVERDRLDIAQRLAEAPVFPVEHLPPIMRGAVEALEEHVQAPRSLCAHSVIGAAMLVAQPLADIEIKPLGHAKPLGLFMLAVAVSGERKSACDNLALAAVAQHEARLRQAYEEDWKEYKAAKAAYDAERRIIERDSKATASERRERLMALAEPPAPLLPVLRAKEPNLEGLLNLLANGQAGVGIFTSEGGQFLGGHGMSQEAKTRTVTGLSELWDAGSAQRVRAKETTFLQGRRVGISLAAQPKVAAALLTDELAQDQGFVGRFLVTMPDSTIGQRQVRETFPLEDARLLTFHRRCRQILGQPLPLREGSRNEVQPPALRLSAEAWAVWQGLAQSFEDDCKADGMWVPVRAAALKMAENAARIAGILTVFEEPEEASQRGGAVSGEIMASAASIALFYLKEALRLTGHSVLDPETRALSELAAWLVDKIGIGELINTTMVQQRAPGHLRTDASITQKRVRKLVEFGALEYVGRAEVDGKTVREAYRVAGEEAAQ